MALVVAAVLGTALLGLLALLFVLVEAGPIGFAIGFVMAILPAPLYLALGLRIDRYEPEPGGMLLGAFAWGATASIVIALVLNTAAGLAVGATYGAAAGELFAANVSAPIVEESAKAVVLFAVYRLRRNEFNGVLDGLVYAAIVGLGFATTENILYYARAAVEGMPGAVFVVRGVVSPFAHPVFTAMTGIGLALAGRSHRPGVRVAWALGGLLAAIALHSLWNTSASLLGGAGILIAYPLIFVPIFIALIVLVGFGRRRELRTVAHQLQHEVQSGLLPAEEVAVLSSPTRRRRALRGRAPGWGQAAAQAFSPGGDRARLPARACARGPLRGAGRPGRPGRRLPARPPHAAARARGARARGGRDARGLIFGPMATGARIFISYRRGDSSAHAGRLSDRLAAEFGDQHVFMDVDTIEPGADFVDYIDEAVGSCDVLIALIGDEWLEARDDTGNRRLEDPDDFVRLEVAAGLARDIRVIPVLVEGAVMPRAHELPEPIRTLARRNALEISDLRWRHDAGRLIETIHKVLGGQPTGDAIAEAGGESAGVETPSAPTAPAAPGPAAAPTPGYAVPDPPSAAPAPSGAPPPGPPPGAVAAGYHQSPGGYQPPPPPGGPGWQAPSSAYYTSHPPKTNTKAIWALVLGIVSIFPGWVFGVGILTAIPAIILGAQAKGAADRGEAIGGLGLSKAAIWTGVLAIPASISFWVLIALTAD